MTINLVEDCGNKKEKTKKKFIKIYKEKFAVSAFKVTLMFCTGACIFYYCMQNV